MVTALAAPLGEFPSSGWKSQQRGTGLHVTCERCNTKISQQYVKGYADFGTAVGRRVRDVVQSGDARGGRWNGLRLELGAVAVGRVVRQALFMLLAVSGNEGLGRRYPVLPEIVDGACAELPHDVRLKLMLVASDRMRISPVTAVIDFERGSTHVVVEVAHFPFAWLLEIGDPSERTMTDVSSWTTLEPSAVAKTLTLESPVGALVTPTPGDYRYLDDVGAHAG